MLFNLSRARVTACNYIGQPICSDLSKIGSEVIPIALATIAAIGTAFLVYRNWKADNLNAVASFAPHAKLTASGQPTHLEISGYSVPGNVAKQHILAKVSPWDHIRMLGVCRNWRDLIINHLEAQFDKGILFPRFPVRVIGVSEWIACFGKENLKALDIDLTDIPLNKLAAIVHLAYMATHSEIEGDAGATVLYRLKGLTLNKFDRLMRERLNCLPDLRVLGVILLDYGDIAIDETGIEALTNNVFNQSRNLSIQAQHELVKKYGCELPRLLSAASLAILTYIISNTRLFEDNPWTYTRCREQATVGHFAPEALDINISGPDSIFKGAAGSVEVQAIL